MHIFYDCLFVKRLWNQLKSTLSNNTIFPISAIQSTIFRYWNLDTNEHLFMNHLLLIFKMCFYNARTTGYLNIGLLLIHLKGIKIQKRNYVRMMQKGEKNSIRNEKMF